MAQGWNYDVWNSNRKLHPRRFGIISCCCECASWCFKDCKNSYSEFHGTASPSPRNWRWLTLNQSEKRDQCTHHLMVRIEISKSVVHFRALHSSQKKMIIVKLKAITGVRVEINGTHLLIWDPSINRSRKGWEKCCLRSRMCLLERRAILDVYPNCS